MKQEIEWEKEFDAKFTRNYIPDGSMKFVELRGSEVGTLKSFIRSTIQTVLEDVEKGLPKRITPSSERDPWSNGGNQDTADGFNEYRRTVLNNLANLKSKYL